MLNEKTRNEALEIITNPVTGEVIRVLASTKDVFKFEFVLLPHGAVAGAHNHPFQHQTITSTVGTLHLSVEGQRHALGPGEAVVVAPGQNHEQWNPADTEVWAIEEFRPAARMHDFFRVLFGMARDGLTDAKGKPGPLLASALLAEFDDSLRVASRLERIALRALLPLARLLGKHRVVDAYKSGREPRPLSAAPERVRLRAESARPSC
jgi:quercetin dioxygenase-like cupin family protein